MQQWSLQSCRNVPLSHNRQALTPRDVQPASLTCSRQLKVSAAKESESGPRPKQPGQEAGRQPGQYSRIYQTAAYQRLRSSSGWREGRGEEAQRSQQPSQQEPSSQPEPAWRAGSRSRQAPDEQQPQQTAEQQLQAGHNPYLGRPVTSSTSQQKSLQRQSGQQAAKTSPAAGRTSRQSGQLARVTFWLKFHADFGQRLKVVGSHPNLGAWTLTEAPELMWSPDDNWNTTLELPMGGIVEYKYVLLASNGAQPLSWQRASVISGGNKATREGRLLSWATEIEALVSSQRNELRRSRMELLSVQNEAQAAREETRKVRAELAEAQNQRSRAERQSKELQNLNRLLRTELTQSTQSFRQAMQTAQRFLIEAEQAMNATPSSEPAGAPAATVTSRQETDDVREVPSQYGYDNAVPSNAEMASQHREAELAAEHSNSSKYPESSQASESSEIAFGSDDMPSEEQRPTPAVQHLRQPASVAGFQFNGSQPYS
ncbi:hypothetical protein WJX74_008813 [Apatococcus lobatus]|uniref:CBM20 domain-containing protein n=1 Tax=Apatococcus lobatus TaxID=904363 RepID=A0AAW1RL47_9CHLO